MPLPYYGNASADAFFVEGRQKDEIIFPVSNSRENLSGSVLFRGSVTSFNNANVFPFHETQ